MKIFAWLLRNTVEKTITEEEWIKKLSTKPEWYLTNIIKNPGEFTVELRKAASTVLSKTKSKA